MDFFPIADSDFIRVFFFLVALLIGVPWATFLCVISEKARYLLFALMVFSISDPDRLGISFLAQPEYRAATRGFDIYLADLAALALGVSLLFTMKRKKIRWALPLVIPYLLFLAVGILSWCTVPSDLVVPGRRVLITIAVTPPPYGLFTTGLYPWFEMWRILRGLFMIWVTANMLRDPKMREVFVYTLFVSATYVILSALRHRYILGVYRVATPMLHPNDLGLYCTMLAAIFVPLLFQQKKMWVSFLCGILTLGMAGCVILTVSRSTLTILGLAIALGTLFVLPRHINGRNLLYLGIGSLGFIILGLLSADTLFNRFVENASVSSSLNERAMFNQEAVMMAEDHPLGVGLGNFSAWSWEKYAQLVDADLEPGVPAHNIWYLTYGELGILGVFSLALIWIRFYQVAFVTWWKKLDPSDSALFYGVLIATSLLHLQSLLHYSYRSPGIYQLTQLFIGLVIALALQQQEAGRAAKAKVKPENGALPSSA